jgi:hypothetical protein
MQPNRRSIVVSGLVVLCALCSFAASARRIDVLSFEELIAASDVVAILEPVENLSADDLFPDYGYGHTPEHFVATNTRFTTHAALKGRDLIEDELTVLHFAYSDKVNFIVNGAHFVHFIIGPVQFEKRAVKDEQVVGGITSYREEPIWLAFLKHRSDGRFEPVTGHYDSGRSFRELHGSSFFTAP